MCHAVLCRPVPCCAVYWLQDYFDQSLDEIKLLRYVNNADPDDEHHIVRLYDFFYYKVRPTRRT